ncbi:hypothetical protein [Acidovorax lacteus]|uniref:Uncharacterized protein n=1 Tax=Acidovorax lacteus TaxID=1924988 RepID=A0ABP8KZ10_9BURK
MPSSALPPDRTSLQSFGDISRFLRQGVADEETRDFRESLGTLSAQIDELVTLRRSAQGAPDAILTQARRLQAGLRHHQQTVTGLGSAWAALYEFGAYEQALQASRDALAAWVQTLERRSRREGQAFQQFEQLAWRALGEALLLLDMYGQQSGPPTEPTPVVAARPHPGWWQRLRRWWSRR